MMDNTKRYLFPWKKLKSRRENFLLTHHHVFQNDEEFIHACLPDANSTEKDIVILLRKLLAENSGIPKEQLVTGNYSSEIDVLFGGTTATMFWLAMLHSLPESVDSLEFFWAIDERLSEYFKCNIQLTEVLQSNAIKQWKNGITIGSWIGWFAREIAKTIT